MWVKICGIRDAATAAAGARFGPDAIGLNFFDASPRCVARDVAATIVRALPEHVEPVGVFVNHRPEVVAEICGQSGINTVQLHGDETPDDLAALVRANDSLKLIRAFRMEMGADSLAPLNDYLDRCTQLGVTPVGCLIDAFSRSAYGGTGKAVDWTQLANGYRRESWPPLILAGGLTPANLSQAIDVVHPWGVDVAGGVESSPGVKDLALVERFIGIARQLG